MEIKEVVTDQEYVQQWRQTPANCHEKDRHMFKCDINRCTCKKDQHSIVGLFWKTIQKGITPTYLCTDCDQAFSTNFHRNGVADGTPFYFCGILILCLYTVKH